MVKKKNGDLRFCCEFRPLNEVTVIDAYRYPESMRVWPGWVKPRSTLVSIWLGLFGKFLSGKLIAKKVYLPVNWDSLSGDHFSKFAEADPAVTVSVMLSPHPACCFRSGLLVIARPRVCSPTMLPI